MSDLEPRDEYVVNGGESEDLALPDTSQGWLDRLKDPEFYKDHRRAAIFVGAAAVIAVGAGTYALSRRQGDHRIFISPGDRHTDGLVSVGEIVEGGAAMSLPVSGAALDRVTKSRATKAIFAMTGRRGKEPSDFVYPLKDPEHGRRYSEVTQRVAGWLVDILTQRVNESETEK